MGLLPRQKNPNWTHCVSKWDPILFLRFLSLTMYCAVRSRARWGSFGRNSANLPGPLQASLSQLVIEKRPSDEAFDLVVRDGKTGFVFFNIEGHLYDYDPAAHLLSVKDGKLLISEEFARKLGRPADAGLIVGRISIATTMYPIEITTVVNGAVQSSVLPPRSGGASDVPTSVPGPDVIVGDLPSMAQFGSSGTQVGLGVGTTSCNNGDHAAGLVSVARHDHPVIPQNLYRMSGGASNDDRFEQIGQSWLKHAFFALQDDACGFGCNPVVANGAHLGVGCSDPYDAELKCESRWLGFTRLGESLYRRLPVNGKDHTGHTHTGTSHRILVEGSDLNTTLNPGATYFAEAQYVTPHEYAWCQAHPGQCNMYNNASYRRFTVSGTTSFTFSPVGSTVRMTPAINAWTGATINTIEPVPGTDGRAFIAYKVTGPSAGVWHYEYAINNQNLDRGIQSFSVPLGGGITVSNLGFHAPLNHPGIANDGTQGDAGYSNAAWTSNQTASALSWSSETFAQNQNANAIRWGTLYNFRFDSNRPPQAANATIGFFKTGAPITVRIQGPAPTAIRYNSPARCRGRRMRARETLDCNLPLTGPAGVECRSGGLGGDHTVVVTFANNVVSGSASVTSGTGSVAGSPTFSGNTMTVNLTGVGNAQTIALNLSNVTDEFSQVLANTAVNASFLLGDTNGDRSVNAGDALQTRNRAGQGADSTNFRSDVNLDGFVNSGDTTAVRAQSGDAVP